MSGCVEGRGKCFGGGEGCGEARWDGEVLVDDGGEEGGAGVWSAVDLDRGDSSGGFGAVADLEK